MSLNFNGKIFRRLLGLLILLAIIFVVGPALFNLQSGNAVINARTIAITAPIGGVVTDVYQPVGSPIKQGQPLLRINNPRINEGTLNELIVEQQTLVQRFDGLLRQADQLEALKKTLSERRDAHTQHDSTRLEHQIAEAKAQSLAQRNQMEELGLVLERNRKLVKENFISVVEFDRSRYAYKVAQQQLEALEARIRSLQTELAAIKEGVYLGEGRNDVPYTQQKIEEINIQIIDLLTRRTETRIRIESIEKQIEAEKALLQKFRETTMISLVTGLVWRQYFSAGSEVAANTKLAELINCDLLFVEAVVTDSALTNLHVGSKVRYRLLGSSDWLEGDVFQIMGSGDKSVDLTLATNHEASKNEGRIFVRINHNALPNMNENQCYVGRRVDVTLKRQWNPSVALTRLTNLFR